MRRLAPLLVVSCLAALVAPAAAGAAQRMYLGFQDDRSFRWAEDGETAIGRAQAAGATVIRATVYWPQVAPVRPASPADPFDPAYRLDDVDELVRNAQERGIEVMFSIWGTPGWANGGKGQNRLPHRLADLAAFARALAARYSGRFPGFPFVRFFTVGNEPNLERFLAPQYDARGRSVGPALYARMYRAAYAGIKAGNPRALVGIGETSPRGRDKPSPGLAQDSHSPGRFAELLAQARPRLKFDAWAHHPYPTAPNGRPTQRVRWPNVTLSQLGLFESSLDRWFGRKEIPIWITEYGHETRPQEPRGVSYSAQAAYAKQALTIARNDPRVKLFIWFMLRDDFSSAESWQSGLFDRNWTSKPLYARFASIARAVDARNPRLEVAAGVPRPLVRIPALELRARIAEGEQVGIRYGLREGVTLLATGLPAASIERDGWVAFRPDFRPRKGRRYVLQVEVEDVNGNRVNRTLELVGV